MPTRCLLIQIICISAHVRSTLLSTYDSPQRAGQAAPLFLINYDIAVHLEFSLYMTSKFYGEGFTVRPLFPPFDPLSLSSDEQQMYRIIPEAFLHIIYFHMTTAAK